MWYTAVFYNGNAHLVRVRSMKLVHHCDNLRIQGRSFLPGLYFSFMRLSHLKYVLFQFNCTCIANVKNKNCQSWLRYQTYFNSFCGSRHHFCLSTRCGPESLAGLRTVAGPRKPLIPGLFRSVRTNETSPPVGNILLSVCVVCESWMWEVCTFCGGTLLWYCQGYLQKQNRSRAWKLDRTSFEI